MEKDLTLRGDAVRIDKKRWENPTLVIVDQNAVGGGPIGTSIEGQLTGGGGGPLSYHS